MFSTTSIAFFVVVSMATVAHGFMRTSGLRPSAVLSRQYAAVNDMVPTKILCDVIVPNADPQSKEEDFGLLLSKYKKCILFAVPGAFTPTCSLKHLPGFIANAEALKQKGVDGIFCLSVNDKHVMMKWGDSIPDYKTSGIQLVGDGNGEFTAALKLVKDAMGGRMGLRSQRYAMVIESGKITSLNVDEKGLEDSSAEHILSLL